MYSKIAYLGKGAHTVNLNRYLLFMKTYDFKESKNIKFLYNKKTIILITDNCDLFSQLKIIINSLFYKQSIIIYWNLEIYLISFKFYFEELLSIPQISKKILSTLKFIIFWMPKIFLNKVIISRSNSILILSSEERKKIILHKNKIHPDNVYVLRNKPVQINYESYLNDITLKKFSNFISTRYFFLPGSINNIEDFNIIVNYSIENDYNIILATSDNNIIDKIIHKNKNVINIGIVPNYLIQYLISKCTAGICLYRNNTSNQKLSASSKLFEFLYFNKPLIVSRNTGVLSELKNIYYENFSLVDNLKEFHLNTNFGMYNEHMLFKNDLMSLNNTIFFKSII
jgi:hypothetical protein